MFSFPVSFHFPRELFPRFFFWRFLFFAVSGGGFPRLLTLFRWFSRNFSGRRYPVCRSLWSCQPHPWDFVPDSHCGVLCEVPHQLASLFTPLKTPPNLTIELSNVLPVGSIFVSRSTPFNHLTSLFLFLSMSLSLAFFLRITHLTLCPQPPCDYF